MTDSPRTRRAPLVLAILLGVFGGLIATLVVVVAVFRDDTPPLTHEAFSAAAERWKQNEVRDYDMDIHVTGTRSGRVHLEVRDGQPSAMTRDGRAPSERRTWEFWTVPGQFDMILTEMRHSHDPAQGFGAPANAEVVQRARFDDALGYPLKYHRFIRGTDLEIGWEVERFQPVPSNSQEGVAP